MKNGKLFKNLAALACAATLGLGIMAGCGEKNECEHVYNWTVTKVSTCTTPGEQTGACGICGDVQTKELPVDETAHVYDGEWEITKPTEEAEGLATKTCSLNKEHKVEVPLPKVTLSGSGYTTKEFITVPTAARAGEMKLGLANELGGINFNVTIAKRKIETVEDAVIIASNLSENIRSATGSFTEKKGGERKEFSYYFGNPGKDFYTRIDDKVSDEQYFYSYDEDGKIFAMKKPLSDPDARATVVPDPEEGNLKGFHYQSTNNISSFYGAEAGLAQLYDTAVKAKALGNCVDYQENIRTNDDKSVEVDFSYSYYEDGWFYRFVVSFATFTDGTLKTLSVDTETIRNYMFATEPDGSAIFYKEGDGYTDKFGIFHEQAVGDIVFGFEYPTSPNGGIDYEIDGNGNLVYEQVDDLGRVIYTTVENGKTVYKPVTGGERIEKDTGYEYITHYGEALTEKPNLHDVYLTDAYGMELLDSKGEKIRKIMAKGGFPVTEHYNDEHPEVNYRNVTFTQTRKVEGETVEPNDYSSTSRYIQDFDITKATLSNGNEAALNALPTNTPITLKIGNIQPATAGLDYDGIESIYVVDRAGERIKLSFGFENASTYRILAFYTQGTDEVTINSQYAGEVKLVFVTQAGECQKEVTLTFAKSTPQKLTAVASVYGVAEGVPDYTELTVDLDNPVTVTVGQNLKFRAVALGNEAAYVSTDILPTEQSGLTFTPVEQGAYEEWYVVATEVGEYTVKMPYYDGTNTSSAVYAQFKLIVTPRQGITEKLSGNTFSGSVMISSGVNTNPTSKTLTAVFGTDGKITITVGGNQIIYTYKEENGELITAWESGIDSTVNPSYDFTFSVNDANDLVITHSTGMGNDTEAIVLSKV